MEEKKMRNSSCMVGYETDLFFFLQQARNAALADRGPCMSGVIISSLELEGPVNLIIIAQN